MAPPPKCFKPSYAHVSRHPVNRFASRLRPAILSAVRLILQGRNFAIQTVAGLATAQHDAGLSCTSSSIYFLRSLISFVGVFYFILLFHCGRGKLNQYSASTEAIDNVVADRTSFSHSAYISATSGPSGPDHSAQTARLWTGCHKRRRIKPDRLTSHLQCMKRRKRHPKTSITFWDTITVRCGRDLPTFRRNVLHLHIRLQHFQFEYELTTFLRNIRKFLAH